ncbi:MAG TPA: PAS domain S-box protein, partial [Opitutaceae bacterium]
AAIGFALSGGAFLAFAAGWLRAGRWLGVACGALGAGTLGLYAVVAWRDIPLFAYTPGQVASGLGFSGRMSPNAALSFAVLGLAFISMSAPRLRLQWLGLLASLLLAVAFMAFCGYVTGLREAAAWWRYTGMALHTSVAFMAAAAGVLVWVVRRAPLEDAPVVRSLPFFATAGGVILVMGLVSFITSVLQEESAKAVTRRWEVQAALDHFIAPMARLDTAVRNFVLTGEGRYVERYETHRRDIETQLASLAQLAADAPAQAARVDALRPLVARRFAVNEEMLRARRAGGVALATGVMNRQPPEIAAGLGRLIDELQQEETRLLAEREHETSRRLRTMRLTLGAGMLLTASLVAVAFHLLRRAQSALREANVSLERRVAARTRDLEQSNARLTESERSWRFLADAMPQLVWTARPDGEGEAVNRGWEIYTGMSAGQAQGAAWLEVVHPDDRAASMAGWEEMIRTGQPGSGEARLRRAADGAYRWHLWRARPERDATGRIVRWVGTSTDIHEQRSLSEALERRVAERTAELAAAQAELQSVNRLQRAVLDGTRFGIIATDRVGVIQVFNTGAERMLGYAREELIGRETPLRFHQQGEIAARAEELSRELGRRVRPGFDAVVARAGGAGADEREWTFIHKDGSRVPVLLSVTALRDGGGAVQGFLGVAVDLSARKELEARIQKIASHVPGMVYEYRRWPDGRGCVPYASEGIRELFGVSPEQVRADARGTFDPVLPEDIDRLRRSIDESAATLRPWRCEFRVQLAGGPVRWLLGHATPEREEDGAVVWHGVVTDISESKRVEQALLESEQRLRLANESAGLGVWQWTVETDEVVWDAGMHAIYGRPAQPGVPLTYRDWAEAVVPEDLPEQEARLRETLKQGGRGERDFRIRRPDGEIRYVHAAERVLADAAGKPRAFIGINFDVTAQKLAEAGARESRERLATVFNTLAEGVVLQDQGGHILECNPAAERILGLTRGQMAGRTSVDPRWRSVHADGSPWPGESHPAMVTLRTGEPLRDEIMGVHKPDGSLTWISINSEPVRDAAGSVLAVVCSFVDTTERRRAEEALRSSEELFRNAFEVSPLGFGMTTLDGRWVEANQALCRITGYSRDELLALRWQEMSLPEELPPDQHEVEALIRGEKALHSVEKRYRRKDGSLVWVRVVGTVVRSREGQPLYGVAHIEDITARKQAEARLRAFAERLQEKNHELQEFAYAASHDLQEPLRKIQAFGDRLQRVAGPRLAVQELDYLDRMRGAARRMSALISALLAYSRINTEARAFESVALGAVVRAVLQDLELRLETTQGHVEYGELPVVSADPTQMHQLFLNLLGNALKYHRPGVPPDVRISARAMMVEEAGTRGWEIAVEDKGIGFEPQYAETIFGVFQRLHTREQYEGTGVGLAICRRIVERHGGRIRAEGRPGAGARFVFTLPINAVSETRP